MKVHLIDNHAEMEVDKLAMTFKDIKKLQQSALTVNLSSDSTVPLREYVQRGGGEGGSSKRIHFVF